MLRYRRVLFSSILFLLICVITLVSVELVGQLAWRIQYKEWYFNINKDVRHYRGLFEPHPYLVVSPKPGAKFSKKNAEGNIFTISHNSYGLRGREIKKEKSQDVVRIAVFGGSTTYCVSVSDDQTWPFQLEKKLGPGHEVINFGVPGYSTVEHIIQAALNLSEFAPDVAIFYTGWNDARNFHIDQLKSDYSDFHGKTQYSNLCLDLLKIGQRSVSINHIQNILRQIFTYHDPIDIKPTSDAFTDLPDQRALDLYSRNIQTLINLCREFNITPVLVPQIINVDQLKKGIKVTWAPFLNSNNFIKVLQYYNKKMEEIALKGNVSFVDSILKNDFLSEDFMDEVHFNPQGNKKFAILLASYLKENGSRLLPHYSP